VKSFLNVRYQPKGRKKTDLDVLNIRQTTEPVVLGLNERNAKTSIIIACILAAFMGSVTGIRAFMLRDLILSFSAVFLLAMALGIYRKNRACAVLAFLAHAVNQLFNLVFNPGGAITSEGAETYFWFALAIGLGLFGGIIGTFAIHELEREKERVGITQASADVG
jgi:hypothetical protein